MGYGIFFRMCNLRNDIIVEDEMIIQRMTIKEYLERFDKGDFNSENVDVQIKAGWYDWFCKDSSLQNKTCQLTKKLKQLVASSKINVETSYVFFKNNCPMVGRLYDDFRICDMKTGNVIYTVIPSSGHDSEKGVAAVWGKENKFEEPLVTGTWKDVKRYFLT